MAPVASIRAACMPVPGIYIEIPLLDHYVQVYCLAYSAGNASRA